MRTFSGRYYIVSYIVVHIPHRSDEDYKFPPDSGAIYTSSHSTQVRWGRSIALFPSHGTDSFTFHTGQMRTGIIARLINKEPNVHIPHRSDEDLVFHNSDVDCPKCSHSTQVRWGPKLEGTPRNPNPSSHSTQVRWGHKTGGIAMRKKTCSHSTQVRWGLVHFVMPLSGMTSFTFHTGQMRTFWNHRMFVEIQRFTFHTGQMRTPLRTFSYSAFSEFTFHTGQMRTSFPSPRPWQTRAFTFHTGQMRTLPEIRVKEEG